MVFRNHIRTIVYMVPMNYSVCLHSFFGSRVQLSFIIGFLSVYICPEVRTIQAQPQRKTTTSRIRYYCVSISLECHIVLDPPGRYSLPRVEHQCHQIAQPPQMGKLALSKRASGICPQYTLHKVSVTEPKGVEYIVVVYRESKIPGLA